MNNKMYAHLGRNLIGLALLALSTQACATSVTTATPTTTLMPTATQETFPGIPAAYGPVSLILPTGLADSINSKTVDAVTDTLRSVWENNPAHIQIELKAYPVQGEYLKPTFYIFRTQDCIEYQDYAAESRQRLQAILTSPDTSQTRETLPSAPFFNAGQIFAAASKVIPFQNGRGVRFITQYAQYYAQVNNHELIYHFEGLTDDGQYYVIAILPITAPLLAESADPNSPIPDGGVPLPSDYDTTGASSEIYYSNIAALLDATPADDFTPTLTQLDQLIQSLTVGPINGNN